MSIDIAISISNNKEETTSHIIEVVKSLCNNEHYISSAANISAFLYESITNVNWVGFYFKKDDYLYLGPFQGKVACTRIPIGKGVCGTALLQNNTLVVDNVHEFEGHIACDSTSNSEIVTPIIHNDKAIGVLDIDSPLFSRFKNSDAELFEEITSIYCTHSDFTDFRI